MTRHSLRFRLLVAALFSVTTALLVAGVGLVLLFERHVERRISAELDTHLNQIAASISIAANGRIAFSKDLADPRFHQPLSGLYWQVQDETRPTRLRSRSLWDEVIELPKDELAPAGLHQHTLPGPARQTLLVLERQIILGSDAGQRRVRIAVAVDRASLADARDAFATDMLPYLGTVAILLLLASWVQVRIGLSPLDALRRGVMRIRSGTAPRLQDRYPDEVMPLVEELNGLLDAQEQAIERARGWTADLAHGLKTPLMVLAADAQRLRDQNNADIADDLDQLSESMRRRIDRELIRARVRSGVQAKRERTDVRDAIDRVVRTLARTPVGGTLQWRVQAPGDLAVFVAPDDLTELLGNILENASKWAKGQIKVSAQEQGEVLIRIEDDGPGVAADQLRHLGLRGVRLDEQKQGSGLGLAIARDIAEAYGGNLSFDNGANGGLLVTIRLPVAS